MKVLTFSKGASSTDTSGSVGLGKGRTVTVRIFEVITNGSLKETKIIRSKLFVTFDVVVQDKA